LRFDIVFYLVGIVCFILAVFIPWYLGIGPIPAGLIPAAFVIVFILFGIFFISFGYSLRPRKFKIVSPTRLPEIKPEEKPPQPQPQPEPSKPLTDLTRIKGIRLKRIAQLRDLQITSVKDLAQYSAEELSRKMKVSSKITAKWIEQAQNLLKESS